MLDWLLLLIKNDFKKCGKIHNRKYLWSTQYAITEQNLSERLRDSMSHETAWIKEREVVDAWLVTRTFK